MASVKWLFRTVTAVVLVAAVLAGILWGWWWSGADRDELAGWVEAGATAAAFLAAAVAAVFAAGAFRLESRREERWEDQQRSAQAGLVAAWFEVRVEKWTVDTPRDGALAFLTPNSGTHSVPSVAYRNASDVPVTQVRVDLMVASVDPDSRERIVKEFGVLNRELIPPSREHGYWDLDEPMARARTGLFAEAAELGYEHTVTQVMLEFTDAAGRRWLRDFSGELHFLSEPRPPGKRPRWWHRSERLRRRRQRDRDWAESVAPAVHPAAHPASGVAGVEDGNGLSTHHAADGPAVHDELDGPRES